MRELDRGAPRARRRGWRGYLGLAIVLVGAAVAAVATWYVLHARPRAGEVIDRFVLDRDRELVVRAEDGGERSFVELREGGALRWQALIPRYAGAPGRPAVAWGQHAVTVRVERDGRAEVFAFALHNASKLGGFRLAPEREPIRMHPHGPITLSDHERSYEIVGGADWNQLVAIDLTGGVGAWKVDLGPAPIRAGGIDGATVWIEQGSVRRAFDARTGRERTGEMPTTFAK